MMLLDLDLRTAAHLLAALRTHRQQLAGNGMASPPELVELDAACRRRVSEGHGGSRFDVDGIADDLGAMSPRVVTYAEAGRLLAVSQSSVKRLVRDGDLLPVRIAGAPRIRVEDLDDYLGSLARATPTSERTS